MARFNGLKFAPQSLTFILLSLLLSTQASATAFFIDEPKKPSSYYSNDDVRSEKIDNSKQQTGKNYSRKHRKVAGYLNSNQDPVAAEAKWESEKILRVGVIRRSLADEAYANRVCDLMSAYQMPNQGMTVRIIYLPNLVAFHRLETLVEHQCA